MNGDLLDAKLGNAMIKAKILDLADALVCDKETDKDYAVRKLLEIVEYIELHDIETRRIKIQKPRQ